MLRFSRVEWLFMALGAALGGIVAMSGKAGLLPISTTFPSYLFVLIGLGLIEIIGGFATGNPPGTLVRMPARGLAFGLGIAALALIAGSIV